MTKVTLVEEENQLASSRSRSSALDRRLSSLFKLHHHTKITRYVNGVFDRWRTPLQLRRIFAINGRSSRSRSFARRSAILSCSRDLESLPLTNFVISRVFPVISTTAMHVHRYKPIRADSACFVQLMCRCFEKYLHLSWGDKRKSKRLPQSLSLVRPSTN